MYHIAESITKVEHNKTRKSADVSNVDITIPRFFHPNPQVRVCHLLHSRQAYFVLRTSAEGAVVSVSTQRHLAVYPSSSPIHLAGSTADPNLRRTPRSPLVSLTFVSRRTRTTIDRPQPCHSLSSTFTRNPTNHKKNQKKQKCSGAPNPPLTALSRKAIPKTTSRHPPPKPQARNGSRDT